MIFDNVVRMLKKLSLLRQKYFPPELLARITKLEAIVCENQLDLGEEKQLLRQQVRSIK